MNQEKMGKLIKSRRLERGMTQLELARLLNVSDKAVSKWERGCGVPDLSIVPKLSEILHVDADALLRGDMNENAAVSGNMKKTMFYLCDTCGNLLLSVGNAEVNCCGKKLLPLIAERAAGEHLLNIELNDGEWYITSAHDMSRQHYISFIAYLNGDTVMVKKLYPEWGFEVRLPHFSHGRILWYCTKHGLFYKDI